VDKQAQLLGPAGPPQRLEAVRANDNGWPTFDRRFVNYPQFKKQWQAYMQAYHALVSNNSGAKTLREVV
jgi:hypothetical protein